ncbi:MAG: hypothetical protein IKZ49_00955 [Alphaproteobacteria bacterium]|nr:hypothetical protein [Alphaproteobacteria bacterium]
MAEKNVSENVYEAKPNQNLRQTIESALVQARVSKTKKILVVWKNVKFELNADTSVTDALLVWEKAQKASFYQQYQKVKG